MRLDILQHFKMPLCALMILTIILDIPSYVKSHGMFSDGISSPLRFNKREADYTLDDSFWNDESPAGEVERLLKDYLENQELVKRIGGNSYQIIYPVQLRHHEKMSISTREVGGSKAGNNNGRPRSRTGKHFHRTSLLIKAFSHRFRLDLELNTQLLAPNIQQKHILPSGFPHDSHREIEHCYYHGTVKDYPGATAAFHTCNGVSGVIHVGNETFVIHPFYGGDLTKHPHVIFEARTKQNKGCANAGNLVSRNNRRPGHLTGFVDRQDLNGAGRYKRDVRDAPKYIETAIVIDKAMFDKRNGSTRADIVHDAIQVANIADLYFRSLNTRVSVVYIETWQGQNQATIDGSKDIGKALNNFGEYTARHLNKIEKDTTQLLTGEIFASGEAGISNPETVCTARSIGISVDVNTYEPHLLAGTMAHMIGHNIGMDHDDNRDECFCRDWHGCIMSQSIIGQENVQPYKFSECSKTDYTDALRIGHGLCLLNKPNELEVTGRKNCGNGVVEEGEECDCGGINGCFGNDKCCDPITCKLYKDSECAHGECCEECKIRAAGHVCREATNECDFSEVCNGDSGQCPNDVYKKNGSPCGATTGKESTGYCFNGVCPSLTMQCETIWGHGGAAADKQCYEQFNSKGYSHGHCGFTKDGNHKKCDPEHVLCGSLQCKDGEHRPTGDEVPYSKTTISLRGTEYECKSITATNEGPSGFYNHGLVKDGTPCGSNLVCVNQTCVSLFPYIDTSKCPTDSAGIECHGRGHCTNTNKCYCEFGFTGSDCSIVSATTTSTVTPSTHTEAAIKMERKETPYENKSSGESPLTMVVILVIGVSGFFISFTSMAACYRRKTSQLKYEPPYSKKPNLSKYTNPGNMTHPGEEMPMDGSNKLIFTNPSLMGSQKIRRLTMTGDPDDPMHAGLPASDVERTLKSLNGYHEDILEALRNAAAAHRSSGNTPSGSISEEILRKTLQECAAGSVGYEFKRNSSKSGSRENICDTNAQLNALIGESGLLHHHRSQQQLHQPTLQQAQAALLQSTQQQMLNPDEDVGPLRIRNLEDLIRQLEHHSSRHMSPSGSEDIRMSETEAERHYRLESSAACSESSHGSRCRQRSSDDENRFTFGRYRPSTNSRHQHQPHSPHSSFSHTHHSHMHSTHGHSSHHSSRTHLHQDEEGIYADADRNLDIRDVNDSESDELFQAQQAQHRWASEDVVSVLMMESDSSAAGPSQTIVPNINNHQQNSTQIVQHMKGITNGIGTTPCRNDYFQSPPSTESVSSGSVMADQRQQICNVTNDGVNNGPVENTGVFGYPEYKH